MPDNDPVYPMRKTGKIITQPEPVPEPKEQPKPARPVGKITEGEKPLPPNRICYAEAFKDWRPGRPVPKCRRCGGLLHPEENHKCSGHQNKYSEDTLAERRAKRKYTLEVAGDWDDDQYDRTTPAHVPKNPDEEDSGVIIEGMTEGDWLMWKFGTTDIPDFSDD